MAAYGIKVGADAFKTWAPDLSEVKRRLARLRDEIGSRVSAPYTNWKRNGAFKDWVPVVTDDPHKVQNTTIAENAIHADPNVAGGLINDILRYTLPSIYVPEVDDHKPLRWFRDWAIKPQDVADFQFVDRMIRVYNNLVSVAFVTFEAEALRIVGERPGLATVNNKVIEVVVPGMSNQDPHARLGKEYGQVEVQTIS